MKRYLVVFILLTANVICVISQTILLPNYSLKSHETLEITKIEIKPSETLIYLTIENRIEEGNFCADRNIYLLDSDGNKLKLKKSTGIEVCPDTYTFKNIGEKLNFVLIFPPVGKETKWVDIIEDCADNCFWFYGVTLDTELNKKLDNAFSLASEGEPADNMVLFKNILDSINSQNLGIEGLLYLNIINAAIEDADNVNTIVWYKRLASSHAPRVNQYLKYLNDKGIKY